MDVVGKVALVTGSTSGIGLGIAHALAVSGCHLIITGREDSDIPATLADLCRHGTQVEFIGGNLLDIGELEALVDKIFTKYPEGIDILINNAGFNHIDMVEDFPDDKWNGLVGIHLSAPFHLIKRLIPKMKRKGWGRIVNISSQLGIVSIEEKAPYSAVKTGLIGLTKGVALEAAQSGVTCNAVLPTYARTKLIERQMAAKAKANGSTLEIELNKLAESIPTKRLVEVEEIADLVVFLVKSKASAQMTGVPYLIDGGYTAK